MAEIDRDKWNQRFRAESHAMGEPSSFLAAASGLLPPGGTALDIAGGAGRHAVWLARRGFAVTLIDISPVGIELARDRANSAGVTLTTAEVDLDREPLPDGPFDVVLLMYFLSRPLFERIPEILRPGGRLLFAHATRSNAARHARPPLRYLIEDGEAPRLLRGLELVSYAEGWFAEGRHEARVVARRPLE